MVKQNAGLTLVELIVAAMVSTIVIGGLFAMMESMQSLSSKAGQGGYVSIVPRTIVSKIIEDASKVVGSGDTAVMIGVGPQNDTFCLAQDTSNPPDAVADKYVCYSQINAPGRRIWRCEGVVAAPCANPTQRTEVGRAVRDTINQNNPKFDEVNGDMVFEITITSRARNDEDKSETNPEETAFGSVAPPGYRF